jgi:hypothetical protein
MVDNKKQVCWIAGAPTSGKTFTGDYLDTRGWHHIDGDIGAHSPDAEVRGKFQKMFIAFPLIFEGKEVPKELWQPYFQHLIDLVKAASKDHDKVVITHAIMGLFNGE